MNGDRPTPRHSEVEPARHLHPAHEVVPGRGFAPTAVPPARSRFILYVVGALLMAYGLRGIITDANGWTHPFFWLPLVAVAAVAHDLVLVPVVFAIGVPLARGMSAGVRRYLVTGAGLSAIAFAVSWPGLRGYGRTPDNPSILPLDYAHGLRVVLVVLWLGLLALFAFRSLLTEIRATRRFRHSQEQP